MTSMQTEDLIKILKPFFPNADKIKITQNSLEGISMHYTSEVVGLTFEFYQDGKQQSKQLVMKVPKRDQAMFSYFQELDVYDQEIIMYKEMIPLMNNYLHSPLAPTGYYATDSQVLILENVTAQGYLNRDSRFKPFTLEECKTILEVLANFHAASYKVHQQHPRVMNISTLQNQLILSFKQNTIETWQPVLLRILERTNSVSLTPKFTAAMRYLQNEDDEIRLKCSPSNFKFNVLNHGEFKFSNFLTKYDTNDQLKDVKIIDFQSCIWSSPVLDIMYLFTTSVSIDIVEEYFETLVGWYLQCLNDKLQKLNCPQRYVKFDFMTDFKHLSSLFIYFIMISCFLFIPLDQSQIGDTLFKTDTKAENTYFSDVCLNDERFVHASYGWLKFCDKMGGFDAIWNGRKVPELE